MPIRAGAPTEGSTLISLHRCEQLRQLTLAFQGLAAEETHLRGDEIARMVHGSSHDQELLTGL